MELVKEVEKTIEKLSSQGETEQARRIAEASRMFDNMVKKGWLEAPSYKLAPISTLPLRSTSSK